MDCSISDETGGPEYVDLLIISHQPAESVATAALDAGLALAKEKRDSMSEEERRDFAPYLAGSIAESYLRLATVAAVDRKMRLVEGAVRELRSELTEPAAAVWSMLRIADLEHARNRPRQAIEILGTYFHISKKDTSFLGHANDEGLGFGLFLEKSEARCRIVDDLRAVVGIDRKNIFAGLLLADALRRSGDLAEAQATADELEQMLGRSTQWQGEISRLRLALIRQKIRAALDHSIKRDGNAADKAVLPSEQQLSSAPYLLVDIYELGGLLHDDVVSTRARVEITKKMPSIMKVVENLANDPKPCPKEH